MKIILTKDVSGLGRAGDVKEVSDGYARNFLIPKHLALPATTEALNRIQKEEAERQAKVAKESERAILIKNKLEGKTFTIKAKTQKQNLFSAVAAKEIALVISEKSGIEISPQAVVIKNPVKSLGLHEVEIKLGQNIKILIRLNIENI